MASERSSTAALHDEELDDVPLMGGAGPASVRRAHTTSTMSRFARLGGQPAGSTSSLPASGSRSPSAVPAYAAAVSPSHGSLHGAVGAGRATTSSSSSKASSSSSHEGPKNASSALQRAVNASFQGQPAFQGQFQTASQRTHDAGQPDDEQAYNSGTASLSRHASAPISRALRRGNNAGAPWIRTAELSHVPTVESRLRSNSSTAVECLTDVTQHEAGLGRVASHSPPSSNSGFIVTSRSKNALHAVPDNAGLAIGAHARSWSVGLQAPEFKSMGETISPAHSRHASENGLIVPRQGSDGSSPSPASPIDPGLLGQANPWSPTPEEKAQLREHSSHKSMMNDAGPRRSNSLSAKTALTSRQATHARTQPQRKTTPALPPLQTDQEVLYSSASRADDASTQNGLAGSPSAIMATPASRFVRGPQSAAPYVPPIGHSHSSVQQTPSQQQHQGPVTPQSLFNRTFTPGGPSAPANSPYRTTVGNHAQSTTSPTPAASNLSFPSLHGPTQMTALQQNLALQQQILAQQAQHIQEQQNQLVAALQSRLTLHGMHNSPSPTPPSQDTFGNTSSVEALQRANAALAAITASTSPNPSLGAFAPFSPPLQPHLPLAQQQQQQPPSFNPSASTNVSAEVRALVESKGYNPHEFNTSPASARFFVIKSFTEDDVFKSIKHEIWSSTPLGNKRLDEAFKISASQGQGKIYLFFSVNGSGHFCGVAEMLSAIDYSVTSNVWAQNDKWKGVMNLRWIFIRDIPNPVLRHLRLTNTQEQKPVTSSRDTQEVPYEQGCEMLRIFHTYQAKTSLLQDFSYYQSQMSTDSARISAGHPSGVASFPHTPQQSSQGFQSFQPSPPQPVQAQPNVFPASNGTFYQTGFPTGQHYASHAIVGRR